MKKYSLYLAILIVINCMACASPIKGEESSIERGYSVADSVIKLYFPERSPINTLETRHFSDMESDDSIKVAVFNYDEPLPNYKRFIYDQVSKKYYLETISELQFTELDNVFDEGTNPSQCIMSNYSSTYNGLEQILKDRYSFTPISPPELTRLMDLLFKGERITKASDIKTFYQQLLLEYKDDEDMRLKSWAISYIIKALNTYPSEQLFVYWLDYDFGGIGYFNIQHQKRNTYNGYYRNSYEYTIEKGIIRLPSLHTH